jgi:hypothetical protein
MKEKGGKCVNDRSRERNAQLSKWVQAYRKVEKE